MRRFLIVAAFVTGSSGLAAGPGVGQTPEPDLFLVAKGDTVVVHITAPPDPHHGFHLYRARAGEELVRITPQPVRPLETLHAAPRILGADHGLVRQITEAENDVQMFRRLRSDRFAAGVASLLSRRAAWITGRAVEDGTVEAGETYDYRVVFLDAEGRERPGPSPSGRVEVVDVLPRAPASVQVEGANRQVEVTWRYPDDDALDTRHVIGFQIERTAADAPGAEWVPLRDLPLMRPPEEVVTFVDRTARNDVAYRYRVFAVDLVGRVGAASEAVVAEAFDDSPPSTPRGLATDPGNNRVDLVWQISPERRVTGYHVERSTGLDQPYERLTVDPIPLTEPVYRDSVSGGRQYFYRVVAVDRRGIESRPSNAISAVPVDRDPPPPPTDLTVEAVDRRLDVRWNAPENAAVRGYFVYRGEDPDRLLRLTPRPVEDPRFLDEGYDAGGLNPGGRYHLRVTAVDHSWNESEPLAAEVVVPDDVPPAPVSAVHARSIRGREAEITWPPSVSTDVERYVVTRERTGAAPTVIATVPKGTRLAVRDTEVERGVAYRYAVVAVDDWENVSEPTVAELTLRRAAPPPAPRHLSARLEENGVRLAWERVVDADLEGYRLYAASTPTGRGRAVSEVIPAGAERVHRIPGGSAETYYHVRAIDRFGNESAASPAVRPTGP